jgi:hypothetical protein
MANGCCEGSNWSRSWIQKVRQNKAPGVKKNETGLAGFNEECVPYSDVEHLVRAIKGGWLIWEFHIVKCVGLIARKMPFPGKSSFLLSIVVVESECLRKI